ncbi:MAG: DUF2461 domain-containing protein [Alphaproteobacteria bacterium]|nr:DUF2461 domain-containing protein [Alphaproteobacteria bacterium]
MAPFPGFGDATFDYLDDLADHNDRDWFNAHKDRYEACWLQPAIAFVDALAPQVARLDPPGQAEAKVNGSIWRIQRDTRFSADKTPYKTHLAFLFWTGAARKAGSAYYVGLEADRSLRVGGGRWMFDKPELQAWRDAVASPEGERLGHLVGALEAGGWTVGGEQLARPPKPFPVDHPRADLLRRKGFHVVLPLSLGADLGSPAVVDHVVRAFQSASPVLAWMDAALGR